MAWEKCPVTESAVPLEEERQAHLTRAAKPARFKVLETSLCSSDLVRGGHWTVIISVTL